MMAPIVEGCDLFPEQWIRVHQLGGRVGRIRHYNNPNPARTPGPANTCLGRERFRFAGDGLRRTPEAGLVETARRDAAVPGLAPADRIVDGAVVRVEKAYSVYEESYAGTLQAVRDFLAGVPNL